MIDNAIRRINALQEIEKALDIRLTQTQFTCILTKLPLDTFNWGRQTGKTLTAILKGVMYELEDNKFNNIVIIYNKLEDNFKNSKDKLIDFSRFEYSKDLENVLRTQIGRKNFRNDVIKVLEKISQNTKLVQLYYR